MTLRRYAPLVLALLACQAELDRRPLRAVEYAVFDPANSLIPLPNDLALASAPSLPDGAQKELLIAFAQAGGFPNDQEVPLTIDFTRGETDPESGAVTYTAPDVVLSSVSSSTLLVVQVTATGALPIAMDYASAQYVKGPTRGTLTLRRMPNAGKRNWDPGARYAVAVRGGARGVQVEDGHPAGLQPQPTFYVLRESALADRTLTDSHNQFLLPGTPAEKAAAAAQLETIRTQMVRPALLLLDASNIFPASEVALLQTFAIEAGASVPVDAGTATLPLPIDLLRNPDTVQNGVKVVGKVVNNPAFGPAAAGLATLDGFSTTAMILAPTSAPIDAATVQGNVALYKLNGAAAPTKVLDLATALGTGGAPGYVAQPDAIGQPCGDTLCATAIGLAPAVPAPVPGLGTVPVPPLDEATEYAVVVTNGVKDATGAPLKRSTFAKILLSLQSLPVDAQGKSQLVGVSDAIAGQIALMKGRLAPVLATLSAEQKSNVVMAWTFRTQSITGTSLQLSAAAYNPAAAAAFVPGAPVANPLLPAMTGVAAFYDVKINTFDAIDPATGALNPNNAAWPLRSIDALVAVPVAENVPFCAGSETDRCAPLAVVHHGLGGGRYQAAAIASTLTQAGYVVVAIDAPYHGHRAFCSQDSHCATSSAPDAPNGVCTPDAAKATQGDAIPPGTCTTGALRFDASPSKMTTTASGNYFISANFFRIRDAIRQDLIDHGAVTLAFAPPAARAAGTDPFVTQLGTHGIAKVDPSKVHYVGVSLGGIVGTNVVATNPRFSSAVLSVAGGPLVDVFTNAPAFATQVDALFEGLGIDRHDPADAAQYLKTLNVAKWILDPADPVNFAQHLATAPLPHLLANPDGSVPQPAKDVLGQIATCDPVVPNPYNALLYGLADVPVTWFESATAANGCVGHSAPIQSPEGQAQIASFLTDPSYVVPATPITLP
jgi:pimeloyl-ACP methyl ester carboxylesterase